MQCTRGNPQFKVQEAFLTQDEPTWGSFAQTLTHCVWVRWHKDSSELLTLKDAISQLAFVGNSGWKVEH